MIRDPAPTANRRGPRSTADAPRGSVRTRTIATSGRGVVDVAAPKAGPPSSQPPSLPASGMLRNAMAGSVWTVVSRVTGLGETITVGAILGATYLGNTYQAMNSLPNLIYYQLLAGSLFASLLVPPMVAHVDRGDRQGAQRLVGGFLGRLLLIAGGASALMLVAGHLIVRLLTIGVSDPVTAAAQNRVGWLLLVMFVPQISLYAVAGTWGAVMNAHGRFALAAGAPTLENLGIISTLIVAGTVFGVGTTIQGVTNAQLLLLGLGTTSAVALHATCQWLGARSVGMRFRPASGWRDPEVRRVVRRIPQTLAYTGAAASQIVAILVVANRIAGGLVGFQLALSFFYLPTAIVTWPIARATLPNLSRFHHQQDDDRFGGELVRAIVLAMFVTTPIAVAYITLSFPMARAVAFGHLATPRGITLVAVSMATLGAGVLGETCFILGTYAFYARQDVRSPLRSMAVRVLVSIGLMAAAWLSHGTLVLAMLGLSLSAGSVAGALHIGFRLRKSLPQSAQPLLRPLRRTLGSALVMAVPAFMTTVLLGRLPHTHVNAILTMLAAALVGVGTYVAVQTALRAPELIWIKSEIRQLRGRGAT